MLGGKIVFLCATKKGRIKEMELKGSQTQTKRERPTSGQIGYITPVVLGVPNASERGVNSTLAHKWADWLHNPYCLGVPNTLEPGTISALAHKWADWLHNPCRVGDPQRFREGRKSTVAYK